MTNRVALAALAVACVGCGESQPPPTVTPPASKKVAGKAAPEETPVAIDYTYNPVGKRDPFRNLGQTGRVLDEAESVPSCTDPLCQYKLSELNLVAVVSGDANPMAMLEDASGVGYLAYRFTKIGKEGGKVTNISRSCITVTSYLTGMTGKAQENTVEKCVAPSQANAPVLDFLSGKRRE